MVAVLWRCSTNNNNTQYSEVKLYDLSSADGSVAAAIVSSITLPYVAHTVDVSSRHLVATREDTAYVYSLAIGTLLYSFAHVPSQYADMRRIALWDDALLTRLAGEEHAAHGFCVLDPASGLHRLDRRGLTLRECIGDDMIPVPMLE